MRSFVVLVLVFIIGYAIIWNGVSEENAQKPIEKTCIYLKQDACVVSEGSDVVRVDISSVDKKDLKQGDTVVYEVTTAHDNAVQATWYLGIFCLVLFVITRLIKWTGIGPHLDGSSLLSALD